MARSAFRLAAALVATAWAGRAQTQELSELNCAARQVPAEMRAELRSLYAEGGLGSVYSAPLFSDQQLMTDIVVNCVDVMKPGHEERSAALGHALASYEVANAAEAALRSRHGIALETLNGSWSELAKEDRRTFESFARAPKGFSTEVLTDALGRFVAPLRTADGAEPDLADNALIQDAVAYVAMRALLEAAVGPV